MNNSEPDLLYSDVEDQLRDSVRSMLARQAAPPATIKRTESAQPYDPALWRALVADVGVAALPVPEERGGHGASWREVAVIAEELGAAVVPSPYLGHSMATTAVRTARAADVLATLLFGERTATLVFPAGSVVDGAVRGGTDSVTGTVRGVIDAGTADLLIVPADDGLYAVDATAATRTPVESLDLTRPLTDIAFEAAAATRLGDDADTPFSAALLTGSALLASEQLGIAQQCLDMTVAYVKSRYQFGRQIGSYQALKHRMADLWTSVTQARAVARYAAACVAQHDPDARVAAEIALAFCGPVAVKAAEECVQLHGGIGFTWEHPAHLYLKRAKADSILLRSARVHRARLGELVDLVTPGPAGAVAS